MTHVGSKAGWIDQGAVDAISGEGNDIAGVAGISEGYEGC